MGGKKFSVSDAKQIDLVGYLAGLGIQPAKVRNSDHWYLSPFRDEKDPSFKVNSKLNLWYDHGIGKGGDLIDFGKMYHKCTVTELLQRLRDDKSAIVSFRPAVEKKKAIGDEGKIIVTDSRAISDLSLREYLHERNIPLTIANRFCHEVDFRLYNKKHTAIGFKNNAGGYELRNGYFKGSSSPKGITLIGADAINELSVFEGFFSFLSFHAQRSHGKNHMCGLPKQQESFLILNSLSFFEKSREVMEKHPRIRLFLDRDDSGLKSTKKALEWSQKYIDESLSYHQFKDLNECVVASREIGQKQSRGLKP